MWKKGRSVSKGCLKREGKKKRKEKNKKKKKEGNNQVNNGSQGEENQNGDTSSHIGQNEAQNQRRGRPSEELGERER